MERYTQKEVSSIIRGYKLLDNAGELSNLLKRISSCRACNDEYSNRSDLPLNCLVRPIPLFRLRNRETISKYYIRVRRDDGFLRNLFEKRLTTKTVLRRLGSTKFSIGINPWLDRCMLHRKFRKTKLMIVGIDYKHFPVFHKLKRDHNFPLDGYTIKNNIWGPTWRRFWQNVLNQEYDDSTVDKFIRKNGVFMTNSMLCFGGSGDPQSHFYGYLKCCRDHVREMIRIVRPEILVSFGDLGCRNVASILLGENENSSILSHLATKQSPMSEMESVAKNRKYRRVINARFNSREMKFWPLYQPAWSHIHKYRGDYTKLRHLLDLR
ncbi:MAG: hypothetical protein JRJ11_12135 [Deltaproteobacteria bacterium]|nr:hypothetical protein [Deltaproteobacteria bacterium]MBW1910273.1 hypothetical protein [Deltaproteobacteria bacterium]MBW2035335.1 hypothetical protein [Deltaproteobacteria bacterium]MBW2357935.1 hypothetical protein [Deltaproteobacteria bacterium]